VNRPSPTAIGLFVLGALALIVAGVLFFGGGELLARRLPAVTFFEGSVAGLRIGAAVTFRGVQIGSVKSIGIRIDPDTRRSIIQVNMELQLDEVEVYGANLAHAGKQLPALVKRGLTAQLVQRSLVTGLYEVELDFRPDAESTRLGENIGVPEIPSVPTVLETLLQKAEEDFHSTLVVARQTLTSLNELLARPELAQTLKELPTVATQLRHTLQTIDRETAALSGTARTAIVDSAGALRKTLGTVQLLAANLDREAASLAGAARETAGHADTALAGANTLLDPHGRTAMQVQRAIDDLASAAARLRNLAERVDRDPSILIHGR
jgi:paraquat-inducible protein B